MVTSVSPWCQGENEGCIAPTESPSISLMPSSSNMPSSKPSISLMPSIADIGKDYTKKGTSSTKIEVNRTEFKDLVSSCYADASNYPNNNVPIVC